MDESNPYADSVTIFEIQIFREQMLEESILVQMLLQAEHIISNIRSELNQKEIKVLLGYAHEVFMERLI